MVRLWNSSLSRPVSGHQTRFFARPSPFASLADLAAGRRSMSLPLFSFSTRSIAPHCPAWAAARSRRTSWATAWSCPRAFPALARPKSTAAAASRDASRSSRCTVVVSKLPGAPDAPPSLSAPDSADTARW